MALAADQTENDTATGEALVFDPHSPELTPDRAYELDSHLRATCPVARGEKYGGYWAFSLGYDDVKAAATDHKRFSSTGG